MANETLSQEYLGTLPIVDIILKTQLEDVAKDKQNESCDICEGPVKRVFLEHICYGSVVAVRAKNAAGFRCESCETGFFSSEALIESLTKAGEIMKERGDATTPTHFQVSIKRLQEIIDSHKIPS